jgi:PKHD-type hydroxylase
MKGEWCYIKQYLSRELCEQIIKKCKERELKNATIGSLGSKSMREDNIIRRSRICFIKKNDPEFDFLFKQLLIDVMEVNNEWFKFHLSKLDTIQFAEYDSEYKGTYQKHMDVFWMNNDPEYHRKISLIIQLSDENSYEGGELQFFELSQYPKKEEIRQQGTAIFFPSFIEHQLNPVTKGRRYSLVCWFDGPKWK